MLEQSEALLAKARAQILRLLADCYYLPGEGLSETVSALAEALDLGWPGMAEHAAAMRRELAGQPDPGALAVEFARLFVGPFSLVAPPYASVYLEEGGRVMGESTSLALNHYREAGLDLSPDFLETPDHIAAELEFLHYLACQEAAALEAGDWQATATYRSRQAAFFTEHLAAWLPEFIHRLEQGTDHEFYRRLAQVTREIIFSDGEAET
jgi:TorA maturation chaperone TorD